MTSFTAFDNGLILKNVAYFIAVFVLGTRHNVPETDAINWRQISDSDFWRLEEKNLVLIINVTESNLQDEFAVAAVIIVAGIGAKGKLNELLLQKRVDLVQEELHISDPFQNTEIFCGWTGTHFSSTATEVAPVIQRQDTSMRQCISWREAVRYVATCCCELPVFIR